MPSAFTTIIYILIFASAFLAMQLFIGVGRRGARTVKRANLRMHLMARKDPNQTDILKVLRKSRGMDERGHVAKAMFWLNTLVVHSGLRIGMYGVYFAMAVSAIIIAIPVLIFSHNFILAAIGCLAGIALPVFAIKFIAKRRKNKAIRQLPDSLDVIVRSLRAGHPVPVAIDLVAREMPDPIGSEFGMASDEITYGTELGKAIQKLSDRVGHADFDMLAATIRLQEKTGGNLAELLGTNAKMVRERQKMRLKIKAASAEGRMSALILNIVPFILFAAVNLISPDFYGEVKDVPFIKYGLGAALVWMFIGNLVIRKMINFRI